MSGRPDNRTGFRIFFGLSSFQALAMFRRGIFYTFLAVYLRSGLGLSVTETTLCETIPMILNVLFQTFIWGRIVDRFQLRRSLIIIGELVAGIGHILMWYFHSIAPDGRSAGWVVISGLAVIEIFWSMSNIGWSAYIADVYDVESRNSIQGKLSSIGGGGRIIGALVGGLLYDGYRRADPGWGFREGGIFFVSAAVMLVSVIPLLFMPEGGIHWRDAPAKASGKASGSGAAGAVGVDGAAGTDGTSGTTAGNLRIFILFLAAMLLINSGSNSLGAFKAQFLDLPEGFAASARIISLVSNVESLALIAVGLLVGSIGRRIGIQRLLMAGAGSGLVALVLYTVAPGVGWIFVAAVFKGISDASVVAASYTFASTLIPPEKRGRWFAVYNATFFLSWGVTATFISGPLIDGLIIRGMGPVLAYRAGFASAALLIILGMALLLMVVTGMRRSMRKSISLSPN
ncbi:MAG: MFS transporter [Spirochaetia bacterium]|jgi:MFS family permease|nr:MFS transporter [Spirochaetia bacterium]